jgi:hypothetical protein
MEGCSGGRSSRWQRNKNGRIHGEAIPGPRRYADLARTLLTFEKHRAVDAIIVAAPRGDEKYLKRDI